MRQPDKHALITEFIDYGRSDKAYSVHTLNAYRSVLNAFAAYLAEAHPDTDLRFVTAAQIVAYDQSRARTRRPRSRSLDICTLRSFYGWLVTEKALLKKNPAAKVKPPSFDGSHRTCPVGSIRTRLMEATERLKSEHRGIMARAVLGVMLYAALRPADVCALHLSDLTIQPDRSYLVIQTGKGRKRREVPLADDLVGWLQAWLAIRASDTPFVFCHGATCQRALSQYLLRALLREVKAAAGIRDAHLTPHSLRHSCATTLYEAGADILVIQEILGHSTPGVTRSYVHVEDKRKFDAVQRLNRQPGATGEPVKRTKPVQMLKRKK